MKNRDTVDSPENSKLTSGLFKLIAVRPVAALDACLDALAELRKNAPHSQESVFRENETKLLNLYARAALAGSGDEDAQTVANPIDHMFSPAHGFQKKKDLALFLVRLLVHYPDVLKSQIAFRLFSLLDEELGESLYRLAKIDANTQTFAKEHALRDVLHKIERDLDLTIASLNSLDTLEPFKLQFLKQINYVSARLFIHPFLPKELRDADLLAIIHATSDFAKATGPEVVPIYRRTQLLLSDYIGRCDLVGTEYGRRFGHTIAEKLQRLAKAYFESTPFSKPAALVIGHSPKKYPLHNVGITLPISVVITNNSDGFALDVRLTVRNSSNNLHFSDASLLIGGLEHGDIRVELAATIMVPSDSALLDLLLEWKNADSTPAACSELLEVTAQREGVDWHSASTIDPYSLSPVSTVDVLVGRDSIIDTLLSLATSEDVGSAFIRGQKRVGKTSIAKTLQSRLLQLYPDDYVVVYLEAGDYMGADGPSTIQRLGRQLCRSICRADVRLKRLDVPVFDNALSPLTEFLQEVADTAPSCRLLFILDEFDELPLDLYKRGALGDAFFRTIRSISNKPNFGFVLVGSEKMEYVLSCQGDSLNKFVKIPVDYFDKESHLAAFADLVRRPAAAYLDYADSAVASLHAFSAGNPYFAKLICRSIYRMMIDQRDSHVTNVEVERAVNKTLPEIGAHSFQHFWQDGIIDPPPRAEEIAIRKAKVLLAFTDCVRNGERCDPESVAHRARGFLFDDISIEPDLRSFERRKVLESKDGVYSCTVKLFQRWLVAQGYFQILTTFVDHEELARTKQRDELLRIKDDEVLALVESWDIYLGRRISEQQVSAWLAQFSTLEERRLMLGVLRAVRFYSTDQIRTKLSEAHGIVTRGTTWHRKHGESTRRRDVVVTYLGGPGHSGAEYARRYGDENLIFPDNVVTIDDVEELLKKRGENNGVILIDDFIGSGQTVGGLITASSGQLQSVAAASGEKTFLIVVCGLADGIARVQRVIEDTGLKLRLHVLDTQGSLDGVFGPGSKVFPEEGQRTRARDVAFKYGLELLPEWPLGYGNSEATIVFDHNIPNNCLPILWSEKKGWRPLFRRL